MKRLFLSSFVVVIVSVLLIKFVLTPAIEFYMQTSMEASIEQYNQDLAKGVYYLIQQELSKTRPSDWQSRIEDLQQHFGYPLTIRDSSQADFNEHQKQQLLNGRIVVLDYGKTFWQRVGNSNQMVGMGPISNVEPTVPMTILVWLSITALIGSVLLVWVFFFWRKLMTVTATTAEFGNGNFDVRVNISPRSALAPLAGAFNSMADRIHGLIHSHKELTNAVSHELRTPISRIRFGLEMMRTSSDKKGREKYAEGIQKDVEELDELVNELLNYASFEREYMEPQKHACEVVPWCRGLAASYNSISETVQFECLVGNKEPKAVFDPRQMSRAVGNLIQNAERYGNGSVKLTLEQTREGILIHIDDNGPGIPIKDRERVFDPFTRLDASRSRESGGFGLGLAIVKRIVESNGATVTISDSKLGGSRFTILCKAT